MAALLVTEPQLLVTMHLNWVPLETKPPLAIVRVAVFTPDAQIVPIIFSKNQTHFSAIYTIKRWML